VNIKSKLLSVTLKKKVFKFTVMDTDRKKVRRHRGVWKLDSMCFKRTLTVSKCKEVNRHRGLEKQHVNLHEQSCKNNFANFRGSKL